MATEVFDLYIQQSLNKLEDLWYRSNSIPTFENESFQQQKQLFQESLTELSTSIEELQLACETLRQQNEELLTSRQQTTRERQYYEQLFDSAPDCYVITTKEGTIRDVNQKAIELLGVSPQYLIRKSLAVFVTPDFRKEYYTRLNQFKQGTTEETVWQLEMIDRQNRKLKVKCRIDQISDCAQENYDLRWQIYPLQSQLEKQQDLTSILISSLRSPLQNLAIQIEENQGLDLAKIPISSHRWQVISKQVFDLRNIINNSYIINNLDYDSNPNLSLIDYSAFISNVFYQINESDRDSQLNLQVTTSQTTYHLAGISDVFLLRQMITNLWYTTTADLDPYSNINIKLTKDLSSNFIIKLSLAVDDIQRNQRLQQSLAELCGRHQLDLVSKSDLEIAAIHRCLALLQGEIELETQQNTVTVVNIKLPLILETKS